MKKVEDANEAKNPLKVNLFHSTAINEYKRLKKDLPNIFFDWLSVGEVTKKVFRLVNPMTYLSLAVSPHSTRFIGV